MISDQSGSRRQDAVVASKQGQVEDTMQIGQYGIGRVGSQAKEGL